MLFRSAYAEKASIEVKKYYAIINEKYLSKIPKETLLLIQENIRVNRYISCESVFYKHEAIIYLCWTAIRALSQLVHENKKYHL